ncbi:hypothetical protein C8Q73DRAFT_642301, partial [Cubamyces lactineus]
MRSNSLLHVASLRYQDEKYVAQNASLLDARALTWLVRNSGRLYLTEELGNAITNFPDLVRHRTMFVQDGVFAFLEEWLKISSAVPFDAMNDRQRRSISSVVGALSMLVSEVEVDFEDYSKAVLAETVMDKTPFVSVLYPPYSNKPTLTNGTDIVVSQLASKLESLPLALASPLLRLLVYSKAEVSIPTPVTTGGGNKAAEDFIQRVMETHAGSKREELGHAVNTIIFVALSDISRQAQRLRLLGSSAASPNIVNDVQYWMAILVKVFVRHARVLDGLTRRQVCWVICALAWARGSPQANGAVIRPLIPRLNRSHGLTAPLVELMSADQDGGVLDTVIMAIEAILWDVDPLQPDAEDHANLCFTLYSSFGPFLVEFYRHVMTGVYPGHRLFKLIVPLTRISTYLSFFNFGDTKASLTATTFSIMKYLVTHHRPAPAVPGKVPVPNLPLETRRWIYRASCRITIMYLND